MLAICVLLLFSFVGLRAQSNEEYNFTQSIVPNGFQITPEEDVPVLSMDGLVANGYGQWTITHYTGTGYTPPGGLPQVTAYPVGWFLLENALRIPSTRYDPMNPLLHPGCIPPGVVQNGSVISLSTEPRVVANMDGTTVYIWPNPGDRNLFTVQVFNPADIDIAIAPGFPNSPMSRQVVKTGPHIIPGINTESPSGTDHNIVTDETDFRDRCDYAIDASFLYITWCSITNRTFPDTREVWVTAYNLQTWALAPGYPINLGQGWRPRLACDPRDNRNTFSPTPQFDIAYLTANPMTETSQIKWYSYVAAIRTTHDVSSNDIIYPWDNSTITYLFAYHVCPLVSSVYGSPAAHHALYAIVDIDEYTQNNTLILYNEDNPNITHTPHDYAAYVDGVNWNPTNGGPIPGGAVGWPVHDHWIEAFANPYDNGDNATDLPFPDWREYDQFHCLYQVDCYTGEGIDETPHSPLLIVRGSDIGVTDRGIVYPLPIDPARDGVHEPYDTRLVLNQNIDGLEGDPDAGDIGDGAWYVAAVNQMGIHVHWSNSSEHYYSRDMGPTIFDGHISRAFDAPIDEKTLVTATCDVTDGTVHGGTVGAAIISPQQFGASGQMTVWTDPIYGPPSLDGNSGLFSPRTISSLIPLDPYVGTLNFIGNNVILDVLSGIDGGEVPIIVHSALSVVPYFYFNFDPTATAQSVVVGWGSIFDYWGLYETHTSLGAPIAGGIGTPFTDGTSDGHGAGTIDLEGYGAYGDGGTANLIVHGGSDFFTGADGNLISNYGAIDVLHENSVYPITSLPALPAMATGHMTLDGKTTIGYSSIIGHASPAYQPAPYEDIILTVGTGYCSSFCTGLNQFYVTNTIFWNPDISGTAIFNLEGESGTSIITNCQGDAVMIHGIEPGLNSDLYENIDIDHSSFNHIRDKCIFIEDLGDPQNSVYGRITVTANTIGTFGSGVGKVGKIYGIYLKNFDGLIGPEGWHPFVEVNDNVITNTGNYNDTINAAAYGQYGDPGAIKLENTTAFVINNTISDNGYATGILEFARFYDGGLSYPITKSLICGNTISGLQYELLDLTDQTLENGICTQSSVGYVKKNTVSGCDINFASAQNDNPKLIYNTFTGDRWYGIFDWDASIIDMSGIHGGGNDDGGHNLVTGPSPLNVGDPVPAGLITLYGAGNIYFANDLGGSGSNWGMNNISVDRPSDVPEKPLIIRGPYPVTRLYIGQIDGNYWPISGTTGYLTPTTSGIDYYPWNPGDASEWDSFTISYDRTSDAPLTSVTTTLFTDIGCDTALGYLPEKTNKGVKPQSVLDTVQDTCLHLLGQGISYVNNSLWQQGYDTLKLFIEKCPNYYMSWRAFTNMNACVGFLYSGDTSLVYEYHLWLESVLYLNTTDPEYFCQCAFAIGTHWYGTPDTSRQEASKGTNTPLAVTQWLIQNTDCDSLDLHSDYVEGRQGQYNDWLDDSTLGDHYNLDTTLPTMHQLGLDTLFAKHLLLSVPDQPLSILTYATASPNPVSTGTTIMFGISQEAYMKINLFDLLGHEVTSPGYEGLFEAGNHEVPLSLQSLASGTYFARILTAYGNVATVKLVKE